MISLVPFANPYEKAIHFARHGSDFGAADEDDYERMGDAFMYGPRNADTRECSCPPTGRRRKRMDFVTVHFGAAAATGNVLVTFYIPEPDNVRRHGGVAGLFRVYCAMHH